MPQSDRAMKPTSRFLLTAMFVLGTILTVGAALDTKRVTAFSCIDAVQSGTSLDDYIVSGVVKGCKMPVTSGAVLTRTSPSVETRVRLPAQGSVLVQTADGVRLALDVAPLPIQRLRPPEKIAHFVTVIIAELLALGILLFPRAPERDEPRWILLAPFLFFSVFGTWLNIGGWVGGPVAPAMFLLRYSWLLIGLVALGQFTASLPRKGALTSTLTRATLIVSGSAAVLTAVEYGVALLTGHLFPGVLATGSAIAICVLLALATLLSAALDAPETWRPQLFLLSGAAFIGGTFAWPGQFAPTFQIGKFELVQIAGTVILLSGVAYIIWMAPRTERKIHAVPATIIAATGLAVAFELVQTVLSDLLKSDSRDGGGGALSVTFTMCSALIAVALKPIKDGLEHLQGGRDQDPAAELDRTLGQLRDLVAELTEYVSRLRALDDSRETGGSH